MKNNHNHSMKSSHNLDVGELPHLHPLNLPLHLEEGSRTMAAHEGENQGTVQPKGRLPRNQVSELTSEDWGVVRLISENLAEARIAVIENQAKAACHLLGELKKSTEGYSQFGRELFRALQYKGVESMDDLKDFLTTTEREGELLAEICGMFNTDVLQVRDVLGEIQQLQNSRQARSQSAQEEKMDVSQENDQFNSDVIGIVDDRQVNYSERFQMRAERPATRLTGAVYGQHSRQHSEPWAKADTEDRDYCGGKKPWSESNKRKGGKETLGGRKVLRMGQTILSSLPAILDTGSMISIIPVGVLARAEDTGVDVDKLEVIPEKEM
ncbi:hypothetical protein Aduo_009179 [Ancylostoma duodenale]